MKEQSTIKRAFEILSLTNKKIASDLRVSEAYVSAIISGKKGIGKKTAKKLSELYGIKESFILTLKGEMFYPETNVMSSSIQNSLENIKNKPDIYHELEIKYYDLQVEYDTLLHKYNTLINKYNNLLEKHLKN